MPLTDAGARVDVQAGSHVALAAVGARSVQASVLAAAVVDLTLINVCVRGGESDQAALSLPACAPQFYSLKTFLHTSYTSYISEYQV